MKKIPVYNIEGEIISEESVAAEIIAPPLNKAVIYYYVKAYLTNQRQGTASTKTRSEVSGGGRKPWRQKGTGRARVGSIRNPLWRHGGVVFGPKPKEYVEKLPKKVKAKALQEVLRDKLKEDKVALFVRGEVKEPKTSIFSSFLKKTGFEKDKILFVLNKSNKENEALVKSIRNLNLVEYDYSDQLNAYEIIKADRVIVENEVFGTLMQYLGEKNGS
ncbi:50S ribosomal protein L4 [bacterium]|nr:50S ribosomal protein L4 [bacterium]